MKNRHPLRTFFLFIFFISFSGVHAQHISDFVSLGGGTQSSDFKHPDTHQFQVIIEEDDPLTGGGVMADRFDFTGYVPIAGSSTNGYLSINHEMNPGGVTILDIQFDNVKQSWSHSSATAVDFTSVQGTRNNCSGTVTPWGTVVTCEENTGAGVDGNSDDYNDFGWSIEIDPASKQVIDQTGGLSGADKLWALGNFKHENIVVHPNERTVYQGEDKNPGHLYKFVADVARDFSSGNLFVYKSSINGSGDWIQLDNTTQEEQNTTIDQAIAISATTFKGVEDVEISPIDGKVYLAVKGDSVVYRFDDDSALTGGSVSNFETYVGDMTYNLNTANGVEPVAWGTGNDNLAFDDLGNLWVLQDGSDNHIWVVNQGHTQAAPLVRIFGKSPDGSEPTGITFTPDYQYLFLSFQHPNSDNDSTSQLDAFQLPRLFDKDVAIVIARKENIGNCQLVLDLPYPLNSVRTFNVSQVITSAATLGANADIKYFAGDHIDLNMDFEVPLRAKFLADIQDCTVSTP